MNWYMTVLQKYADFSGRARPKEYWMFVLFNFLISILLSIVDNVVVTRVTGGYPVLGIVYALGVFLPGLGVLVRRLHDTEKSGFWAFLVLIPCVGPIVLLVFLIGEGTRGSNKFGPDPLKGERRALADRDDDEDDDRPRRSRRDRDDRDYDEDDDRDDRPRRR